jgi:hypothetical protein
MMKVAVRQVGWDCGGRRVGLTTGTLNRSTATGQLRIGRKTILKQINRQLPATLHSEKKPQRAFRVKSMLTPWGESMAHAREFRVACARLLYVGMYTHDARHNEPRSFCRGSMRFRKLDAGQTASYPCMKRALFRLSLSGLEWLSILPSRPFSVPAMSA